MKGLIQAIAALAVGAAGVAFVAGVGTYFFVRFTQNRREPPRREPPPRP